MAGKSLGKDLEQQDLRGFHSTIKLMKVMRLYHRHQVHGLDQVPEHGRAMIVINHSMVLYDIFMLWDAIYRKTGRYTRTLVDRFFYKIPFMEKAMLRPMGLNMASWENARSLLDEEGLILLSPGGMREWGKPSTQRYTINWRGRNGYARLAIQSQTPIILAACPKADDVFEIYDNPLSRFIYKKFKAPFIIARGWGLTNIPRPVKLSHFLSEPLMPPACPADERELEHAVEEFHQRVQTRMKALLMEGIIEPVG